MDRRLLALLACLCCTRKPPPAADAAQPAAAADARQPSAAAPSPSAAAAPPSAGATPDEDDLKPVYSGFDGKPLPLAKKLCDAIYEIPVTRAAACCKSGPQMTLTPLCTSTLSAALRSKGVSLDDAAVDACVAAQDRAHAGCSWVGAATDPLPPECRLLIKGLRKPGELCRSSLECGDGQHCLGVGPMDAGRCGPPRADGQTCRESVDPLANYTRDYDEDSHHGECSGYCGHRKCEPAAALGAHCTLAHQCKAGLHCDGEKCAPGDLPNPGDKCLQECVFGAACVSGRCQQPKADGAACASDGECRGGCLAATHSCGMRCGGR